MSKASDILNKLMAEESCFDKEVKDLEDKEGYDKETATKVAGKIKADQEKEDDECMETLVDAHVRVVRYDNGDTDSFLSVKSLDGQELSAPLSFSGCEPDHIADMTGLDVCVTPSPSRAACLLRAAEEPIPDETPPEEEMPLEA